MRTETTVWICTCMILMNMYWLAGKEWQGWGWGGIFILVLFLDIYRGKEEK